MPKWKLYDAKGVYITTKSAESSGDAIYAHNMRSNIKATKAVPYK